MAIRQCGPYGTRPALVVGNRSPAPVEWLRSRIGAPGAHVTGPAAMTLTHILVFAAAALVALFALPARARAWALFTASVVAIYWLQPAVTIRRLDFAFPTATLGGVAYLLTRAPASASPRNAAAVRSSRWCCCWPSGAPWPAYRHPVHAPPLGMVVRGSRWRDRPNRPQPVGGQGAASAGPGGGHHRPVRGAQTGCWRRGAGRARGGRANPGGPRGRSTAPVSPTLPSLLHTPATARQGCAA